MRECSFFSFLLVLILSILVLSIPRPYISGSTVSAYPRWITFLLWPGCSGWAWTTSLSLAEAMRRFLNLQTKAKTEAGYPSKPTYVYKFDVTQSDLEEIEKKITELESKLTDMEDKYYKKFGAMEATLAKINSSQSSVSSFFG